MTGLIGWITRPMVLTVLVAVWSLVLGAILLHLTWLLEATGGHGILDFDIGYSRARVMAVFGSYGDSGFLLYRRIQTLDMINPALYSLIAAALTARVWAGRGPGWLSLFPLAGGLLDYAENMALAAMARRFPDIPQALIDTGNLLNLCKNLALAIGMAPLLIGFVWHIAVRIGKTDRI